MSLIEEFFPELKDLAESLPRHKTTGGRRSRKHKHKGVDQVKVCESKIRFYSRDEAQRFAEPYGNRWYDCKVCGYFHTTSQGS